MFQPSYLPEIQIWLITWYFRQHAWKEGLQHKSTRWRCNILREWTTIASFKTWAGSATYMWTHCPRQAWSCSSLIIKHYRVQVGNHHRGYRSPCALIDELLILEQVNQWLGVLGTHIEWRLQVSRPQNTSHICMTDLGWFQRKQNWLSQIHGGIFHQMHVYKRKSLLSSTNTSWASMKKMLSKVSNTNLLSNKIMEEIRMLSMGSTTIHLGFLLKGIP